MKRNDRWGMCNTCNKSLEIGEGRVLWDEGFMRMFCDGHALSLLDGRIARRLAKKVADTQLKLEL